MDRAALDFALSEDIPHGGYCPRNRRAEDGIIPAAYLLTECSSFKYSYRTEQNVRFSDATLVITNSCPVEGTALTIECCINHNKPWLIHSFQPNSPKISARKFREWAFGNKVEILNIAGDRESQGPIYEKSIKFLQSIFIDIFQVRSSQTSSVSHID